MSCACIQATNRLYFFIFSVLFHGGPSHGTCPLDNAYKCAMRDVISRTIGWLFHLVYYGTPDSFTER